jgi:hypothetical protein
VRLGGVLSPCQYICGALHPLEMLMSLLRVGIIDSTSQVQILAFLFPLHLVLTCFTSFEKPMRQADVAAYTFGLLK